MNNTLSVTQSEELIRRFLAFTIVNSKGDIILILKKNGIDVPSNASDEDVVGIVYSALPKSKTLRYDLSNYFNQVYAVESGQSGVLGFVDEFDVKSTGAKGKPAPYSGNFDKNNGQFVNDVYYVQDDFFNQDGLGALASKSAAGATKSGAQTQKTGIGQFFSNLGKSLFTPENVQAGVNAGMNILSQKLSSKADQKSIALATQNEIERTNRLIAEEKAAAAKAKASKSWVVPVVIGVSVIALAVGAYFIFRKKK